MFLLTVRSSDHSKALIQFAHTAQATKALVMNGVQFRGQTMHVRFSTTNYVDPVSDNTCPSIRDLTEDYYGKIVHRFNSSEYAQIPWHMPSRKLHVVGYTRSASFTRRFDNTNPNIKEILTQLFGNVGTVESVCVLKNVRFPIAIHTRWRGSKWTRSKARRTRLPPFTTRICTRW